MAAIKIRIADWSIPIKIIMKFLLKENKKRNESVFNYTEIALIFSTIKMTEWREQICSGGDISHSAQRVIRLSNENEG